MNLENSLCPKCRGKLKLMRKPYIIKTRDERRRLLKIENLPYAECTICEYEEITQSGEEIITEVQDMVKVGMEQLVEIEESQFNNMQDNALSNVLKRFIG